MGGGENGTGSKCGECKDLRAKRSVAVFVPVPFSTAPPTLSNA